MGQEGVPGNHRDCCHFPKSSMNELAASVIANLEECGVLERIDRSDRYLECGNVVERCRERCAELVESIDRELIWLGCGAADEPDLLDHDVQEMIGMQADFVRPIQCRSHPIELWLELIGRDPDQAAGKSTVVCSPGSSSCRPSASVG